jgi:hypothetical protein
MRRLNYLKKSSTHFWQNSCFYIVASKQVEIFFKSLWPFQKSWTLTERKFTLSENTHESLFYSSLQSGNTTFLTYAWTCVTPWEKTRQVQAMGGQQIEHHWIRKSAATYIFFPCARNMELIPQQLYLIFWSISIFFFGFWTIHKCICFFLSIW